MTRTSPSPTALADLIDRRATAWNRLWVIVTGLWLVAVAGHLPGVLGALLTVVAIVLVAAAAGLVELSLAVWYRYLREPAIEQRGRLDARAVKRFDQRVTAESSR